MSADADSRSATAAGAGGGVRGGGPPPAPATSSLRSTSGASARAPAARRRRRGSPTWSSARSVLRSPSATERRTPSASVAILASARGVDFGEAQLDEVAVDLLARAVRRVLGEDVARRRRGQQQRPERRLQRRAVAQHPAVLARQLEPAVDLRLARDDLAAPLVAELLRRGAPLLAHEHERAVRDDERLVWWHCSDGRRVAAVVAGAAADVARAAAAAPPPLGARGDVPRRLDAAGLHCAPAWSPRRAAPPILRNFRSQLTKCHL